METLRDPLWQFIGVALALASIAVAIAIAWGQRRISQISFDFYTVPLVKVHPHAEGRVAVLLDGAKVETAAMCSMRLWNSGTEPIRPADFIEPLAFDLGTDVRAFSQEVYETSPTDLAVQLIPLEPSQSASSRNSIQVEPLLLNPGDMFSVTVITEGEASPSLRGRIVGVKKFIRIDLLQRSWKKGWYHGFALGLFSSCLATVGLLLLAERLLGRNAALLVTLGAIIAIPIFAWRKARSNAA